MLSSSPLSDTIFLYRISDHLSFFGGLLKVFQFSKTFDQNGLCILASILLHHWSPKIRILSTPLIITLASLHY